MVTVVDDEADPVFDVLNSKAKALFLRSELTLQNVNLRGMLTRACVVGICLYFRS